MKTTTTTATKKKINAGEIYSGDNGMLVCRECAGQSVLYTLRDTSGKRAQKMTKLDAKAWMKFCPRAERSEVQSEVQSEVHLSCECGKTSFDALGVCTTKL